MLGFVRDMLIARYLGSGPIADAFFVAFKLPNLFRRIFAEGAFSSAFVPTYTIIKRNDGVLNAQHYAGQILTLLMIFLLIFTVLFEFFMPSVVDLLAPGFVGDEERFSAAVDLARLCFPYLIFMALVALLSALLSTIDKYAVAASAPILLNVFLILSLFILPPFVPNVGWALAWGVVAAGVGQFLWLAVSAWRNGLLPTPRLKLQKEKVKKFTKLFVPSFLSASITQVNIFVGTIFASFFPGAVSYLYYADRINQLPVSLIGVAVGIVLLPNLSRHYKDNVGRGIELQKQSLFFGFLLSLPAMLGAIILSQPIISILFEYGAFTAHDRMMTAYVLIMYALGLPSFVLIKILLPGYFAKQDTKTPMYIAFMSVIVNVALIPILMRYYDFAGIALATSLSGWFHFAFLFIGAVKRGMLPFNRFDVIHYGKVLFLNLFLAAGCYFFLQQFWSLGTKISQIIGLFSFILIIISLYAGGLFSLKVQKAFRSAS